MDFLLLGGRLVLAAIFALSAVAKFLDLAGSRQALAEFGVPTRLLRTGSVVLPLTELGIAALLLPVPTANWGAFGALALLALFVGVMRANLARGRTPDCHCFGQLHSEPIGSVTIARNLVLAGVAGLVAIGGWNDPGPSLLAWATGLSGVETGLLVANAVTLLLVGGLVWVVANLMAQGGRILARLDTVQPEPGTGSHNDVLLTRPLGLPVGSNAPDFALEDLNGDTVSLTSLRHAYGTLMLLFVSPGCGACTQVLQEVTAWQRVLGHQMRIVPISRDGLAANQAIARPLGVERMLLQKDREIAAAYAVPRTPAAVIVHAKGTIASPVAAGPEQIRALVGPTEYVPKPVPTVAPLFTLTSLSGETVRLADLQSHGLLTVLVFTDPQCEPCRAIYPDVARWQQEYADRLTVAVISRGTIEANKDHLAQHEIERVLLQLDMEVIDAYALQQAPAVVLVEPDGSLVGAPAYGDLAGRLRVAAVAGAPELRLPPGVDTGATAKLALPALGIGEAVPASVGPTLDGGELDLSGPRPKEMVLLFWNPACGYCQRMVGDLLAWESAPEMATRDLVIVARGTVEAIQAHGFRSSVVLDPYGAIARQFGSRGTPSAVVINRAGRVASAVESGATRVRAMLVTAAPTNETAVIGGIVA